MEDKYKLDWVLDESGKKIGVTLNKLDKDSLEDNYILVIDGLYTINTDNGK